MVETLNAFAFLRQLMMGIYFCGWFSKIRTFSCNRKKKINEGNQEKKVAKKLLQ